MEKLDLTGQRFGNLTVLRPAGNISVRILRELVGARIQDVSE